VDNFWYCKLMRLQCKIKLGRPLHVEFSASLLTSTFLVQVLMDGINAGYERLAELQVPSHFQFRCKHAFTVNKFFLMHR